MKEDFHNRHEEMALKAYETPGMFPHRYVFILTNRCNLNCSFCFQKKRSDKKSMDADDWYTLLNQLPQYARVTMTGGEPLLYDSFIDVFTRVAEKFTCNIITNGILLNKNLIDYILSFKNFRVLSISIDNIGNTIRNVKKRDWDNLEEMMRYFVVKRDQLHPECILDVKTLILDENAKELFAIHQYCMEQLNCNSHSLQFTKGSPIQHADHMFTIDDIVKKSKAPVIKQFKTVKSELEKIRDYNVRSGKRAFLHPKIASLNSEERLPDIEYINNSEHVASCFQPCIFPWSSVHINSDGHLFPCLAVSMGNVKNTSLKDIISGEIATQFKNIIRSSGTIEGCNRCGWLRPR
ncbi:MAG: radical SAM protein [Thermodesulfobacteriota bacterium]|nr:radical SAM protein [Thermodesulfobacteriota bacterium]